MVINLNESFVWQSSGFTVIWKMLDEVFGVVALGAILVFRVPQPGTWVKTGNYHQQRDAQSCLIKHV